MIKKITMEIIAIVILAAIETAIMNSFFTFYPVSAQQMNHNGVSSINMTSAMIESARMHLRDADKALTTGNTTGAVEQLSLAQLQISMMGMKTMATMNETQAMDFMKGGGGAVASNMKVTSDFCIIDNDGKLQCHFPR